MLDVAFVDRVRREVRNTLVVGIGRSGVSAAELMLRLGKRVYLCDRLEKESVESKLEGSWKERFSKLLASDQVDLSFGISEARELEELFGQSFWTEIDLVITSPSAPVEGEFVTSLVRKCTNRAVTVYTELEFGLKCFNLPVVMVTGSNGKSTTSSLIHHLLIKSGFNAHLAGNIGEPVCGAVLQELESESQPQTEYLVVEASSYQLEDSREFAPDVALFLNLYPNHLERHGTVGAYFESKLKPFRRQTGDQIAIVEARLFAKRFEHVHLRSRFQVFSGGSYSELPRSIRGSKWLSALACWSNNSDELVVENFDRIEPLRVSVDRLKIFGRHNKANLAAAISALEALDVLPSASVLSSAISEFSGLPHRIEPLGEMAGQSWINDSKSTTPQSTIEALATALEIWPGENRIALLVGGAMKQNTDWRGLIRLIGDNRRSIAQIVCFGGSGVQLAELFREKGHQIGLGTSSGPVLVCDGTLEVALNRCWESGESGRVVLLSPGCASFDEFSDFENRGNFMREWLEQRAAKEGVRHG